MIIIGIDPGAGGAMAVWDKKISKIYKCPADTEEMADIVKESLYINKTKNIREVYAYMELVHAMPHDGRSSLFKFGTNYGKWLGILGTFKVPTTLVSPQKWMKYWKDKLEIKLPKEKPSRKRKLKEIASHYTDKKITLYNADAILIAMYGMYDKKGEKGTK
tara:strand:+ start:2686 stop:3168 length:483 start_codon:yes stop_codon:yes gene_type:complete